MIFEEYVGKDGKTYIKVGIIGILKERVQVIKGEFQGFDGKPQFGWWKIRLSGMEKPIAISDACVMEQPTIFVEGEELEVLYDRGDNTAWLIARTIIPSQTEAQTDQSSLQSTADGKEVTLPQTEVVRKVELT